MEIQNILTTVDLDCKLNLKHITENSVNVEYNPEKFKAVTMRLLEPCRFTANIFATGKIVCLGMKDQNSALLATRKIARLIKKLGYDIKFVNYKITNLVGSGNLNFKPDLENFYKDFKHNSYYNQESFPGLNYKIGNVTIIVFHTGKLIITNCKSINEINEAYTEFLQKIRLYTKLTSYTNK